MESKAREIQISKAHAISTTFNISEGIIIQPAKLSVITQSRYVSSPSQTITLGSICTPEVVTALYGRYLTQFARPQGITEAVSG